MNTNFAKQRDFFPSKNQQTNVYFKFLLQLMPGNCEWIVTLCLQQNYHPILSTPLSDNSHKKIPNISVVQILFLWGSREKVCPQSEQICSAAYNSHTELHSKFICLNFYLTIMHWIMYLFMVRHPHRVLKTRESWGFLCT